MGTLTIDLRDGFDGDDVVVSVDGERRWEEAGVTTNLAISLAASAVLDLPDGEHDVTVALPRRRLETTERVRVAGESFVSVEAGPDALRVEPLAERPYFL